MAYLSQQRTNNSVKREPQAALVVPSACGSGRPLKLQPPPQGLSLARLPERQTGIHDFPESRLLVKSTAIVFNPVTSGL